jgi:toxin ParE1/3/4
MSLPVTVRSRARIEILEQFYYYGESADLRTANRFLAAVERTASLISTHQGIGRICDFGIAALKGMRRTPVRGFRQFVLFYRANDAGIEIIRVLHGARDIESIFREQERD